MNTVLPNAFIHALGWTLLHALWQGAAAALLLFLALPRLRNATQRYWTAYGALLMVFAAALVTFVYVFEPSANTPGTPVFLDGVAVSGSHFIESQLLGSSIWTRCTDWLEANHIIIVTIWLLGFGFFLLQLAGGLFHIHRLQRFGTRLSGTVWPGKMLELSRRLALSRPVALLESALVHTPMALGYLKPVVLLPVGLVNLLSPAEVEAVLVHELAHIARRDWLFNLLQAFIEALFYYHPAVWWMSGVIRTERENCCDDAAVSITGNRLLYAKTLVQVQELAKTAVSPALALGIDGNVTHLRRRPLLLERIRRVLNQPQPKSHIMEKFIATAILLGLLALCGLRANTAPAFVEAIQKIAATPVAWFSGHPEAAQVAADSVPKAKKPRVQKIVREEDDKRVELEVRDGEVTRLNIDGKEIPPAEFEQHEALTDELRHDMSIPPTPPTPPTPPSGLFWATPPTPPGVPAPPGGFTAPTPPTPPTPPARISTEKDDAGNTIIRIDRGGEPTEIVVKDGAVWMDGKKLEEGEAQDLPGMKGFYFEGGPEGQFFSFPEGNFFELDGEHPVFVMPEMPEMPEIPERFQSMPMPEMQFYFLDAEAKKAWEEQQREMKKAWKKNGKEWKKQSKEWKKQSKEWNENYRSEIARAQLEAELAMSNAREMSEDARRELDVVRMRQDARRNQDVIRMGADARRYERAARLEEQQADKMSDSIKEQLLADKLITDPKKFSFKLSGKTLEVDGKQQSEDLHRKYLELYRGTSGQDLKGNDSIRIEEEN